MKTLNEVKPLELEKWDRSLEHVIKDMNGCPLNVHALMANHPALLSAWWNFRNYSVTGGELGQRKGEIVILRTAHHLQAWYEWGAHVERGLASGLTMEEIDDIQKPVASTQFNESDQALLQCVDELYTDKQIAPDTLQYLDSYFSIQEIMDIMAIQGMYIILGTMIKTWGLELEAHILAKLPDTVTQEDFLNPLKS